MVLNELNEQIQYYIEQGHGEDIVLITLKQPSVGPRAAVFVKGIYPGFDWEQGQVRIELEKDITLYEKDRDKPLQVRTKTVPNGDRVRNLRICPKCGEHIHKESRYCSRCGQRVLTSAEEKLERKKLKGSDANV